MIRVFIETLESTINPLPQKVTMNVPVVLFGSLHRVSVEMHVLNGVSQLHRVGSRTT